MSEQARPSGWPTDGWLYDESADVPAANRKIPRCNQLRSTEKLAMPTQDASAEIKIGYVQSACHTGELKFSIKVEQDGSTYVQIYAHDPSNFRRSGVFLMMGQHEWEDFMKVLHAVQAGIIRLQQADEMRVFAVPRPGQQR